jgi:DNA polymerase-1
MKRERLVVIDGHALIHRAYHAIPPLTTKTGELVNAVYGFTVILLNVIRDLKPKYIVVAFDLPGKTKRHEEYEAYKANRVKAPDDLIEQFERVRDVVKAFDIPIFEQEGYEADDVIGTISKKAPKQLETVIVTGDMDELQLVDERTKVYTMKRGFTDTVIYDEAAVIEKYHLAPSQFVDYKALRGDPSDNIPGVSGVGEKTASELISTYGSLDEVYNNLGNIKPRIAEKLKSEKEIAYLSQKLSRIETGLEIGVDLKCCVVHEYDRAKVFSLFQELGFKSLLSKIPGTPSIEPIQEPQPVTKEAERTHLKSAKYHLVDTVSKLEALISNLRAQTLISFDTETDSKNQIEANLVGMSFSFSEGEAYYVPVGHDGGNQLNKKRVLGALKPTLENPKIAKVGHNIKYDYVLMKRNGIILAPIVSDTMIAAYLVNPNARAQKLSDLAFSELGLSMIKIEELIGQGKNQVTFSTVDPEVAKNYACEDADIALRLHLRLAAALEKADMTKLMEDIEAPLISILGDMEIAGIKVDPKKLDALRRQAEKRIITLDANIKKRAGGDFNIASPSQLQKVLFEKLNLNEKVANPRELKKLKTGGYSTAASELEKLRHLDPIIGQIFEYRELTKLKNTYIDVLPKLIDRKDGRVHTSYNQAIAQTGRLSSSGPNLQNIPVRTEFGKKIRAAFVAEPGKVLLSADYSQIELRVIAHIAKDPVMAEVFKAGRDIHTETAAKVYDVAEKKVTPKMRRIAKIINFGIIYGVSAHGLRQQTGVSYEEGKNLINKYFAVHPAVKEYSDKMIAQAHELGYVETIFGRRRYLPEIKSSNFAVRGAAERMAINMPVQGTAADLMKLAMIDIARELPQTSPHSRLLLQVHDELVLEVPEKEAQKVAGLVQKMMDKVVKLDVPIQTSIHWGNNWEEAK